MRAPSPAYGECDDDPVALPLWTRLSSPAMGFDDHLRDGKAESDLAINPSVNGRPRAPRPPGKPGPHLHRDRALPLSARSGVHPRPCSCEAHGAQRCPGNSAALENSDRGLRRCDPCPATVMASLSCALDSHDATGGLRTRRPRRARLGTASFRWPARPRTDVDQPFSEPDQPARLVSNDLGGSRSASPIAASRRGAARRSRRSLSAVCAARG